MDTFLDWALSVGMVVGPVIGYIPQYWEIHKSKNTEAFSTLVCFILLMANILRIFFWVGKRFELALLVQSVVMIFAQLILLELMVRLSYRQRSLPRVNSPSLLDPSQFWSWEFFGEYLLFLLMVVTVVGVVTLFNVAFIQSSTLTEIIGALALTIEATLAVPQLWRNFRNQSCVGLRWELLLAWFLGDGFKTFFFFYRKSPIQFIACGIFQLVIDCLIALQMWFYRKLPSTTSFDSDSAAPKELSVNLKRYSNHV